MAQAMTAQPAKPAATAAATVTLVDYYAPWCGPCRAMEPVMEEIEKEFAGKVTIKKINVDEEQEAANTAGVMSIPTLHVLRDNKVVQAMIGFQSKEELTKALQAALK